MNLIIAGSRNFDDYSYLTAKLNILLSQTKTPITIISGCAHGADMLGEQYAKECGYPIIHKPANWNKYGKQAGYLRNLEMAKIATHCVVFRVNASKGSSLMIDIAQKHNLPLRIYDIF